MSIPSPVEATLQPTITKENKGTDKHTLCNSSCLVNCCGRSFVKQEQTVDETNQKVSTVAKKEGCCIIF